MNQLSFLVEKDKTSGGLREASWLGSTPERTNKEMPDQGQDFSPANIKPLPTGELLRDRGIKKALDHAEQIHNDWQTRALDFLYLYARDHDRFSGEMVRMEAKGIVPDAPSARTWGAVMLNGARKGWIRRVGIIHVTNPKAHSCFASEWESLIRR
jgi:hypothetical protein